MTTTLQIGRVLYTVDHDRKIVTSAWPDGTTLVSVSPYDDESTARARALGYEGSDDHVRWQMTVYHDACHHVYATALGLPSSEHLYAIARGERSPEGDQEERAVLLLQRAMNVGSKLIDELRTENA